MTTHPKPSQDDRPVLVLGPNPTPNGGMHLGHIAGPYLAGDVYARYQRARGRDVVFTTGTDDSQTFVVGVQGRAGARPGQRPRALERRVQHHPRLQPLRVEPVLVQEVTGLQMDDFC